MPCVIRKKYIYKICLLVFCVTIENFRLLFLFKQEHHTENILIMHFEASLLFRSYYLNMGDRGPPPKTPKLKIKHERGTVYVSEFYRTIVFIVILIICV